MLRFRRRQAALSGHSTLIPEAVIVPFENEVEGSAEASIERARMEVAALYEERGEEFLHYALGLGRDEELAKDALQEAFMRYFALICDGREIDSPRAWIYRVMHNYLLDRLKETRCRKENRITDMISHRDEDIEDKCLQHECLRLIRAALTRREFDCFRLRSEGLKYGEIAAKLHLAPGTVGTLISRAVRKIRSILVPEEGGLA